MGAGLYWCFLSPRPWPRSEIGGARIVGATTGVLTLTDCGGVAEDGASVAIAIADAARAIRTAATQAYIRRLPRRRRAGGDA